MHCLDFICGPGDCKEMATMRLSSIMNSKYTVVSNDRVDVVTGQVAGDYIDKCYGAIQLRLLSLIPNGMWRNVT